MFDLLKNVIVFTGKFLIGALAVAGLGITGALIGYGLYKAARLGIEAYQGWRETHPRKEMSPEKRRAREMKAEARDLKRARKAAEKENFRTAYSSREGWRLENLPSSMKARMTDAHQKEMFFDINGRERFIKAERDGGKITYSFPLEGREQAGLVKAMLQEDTRQAWTSSVVQDKKTGRFMFVSSDPETAARMAQAVLPEREMAFSRELRETRQYVVTGCSSYEEAVAHVQEQKRRIAAGEPLLETGPDGKPRSMAVHNTFVEDRLTVGGETDVRMAGKPLEPSVVKLPSGAYLVNESVSTSSRGIVKIPSDITDGDKLKEFASGKAKELGDVSENRSYSNGMVDGSGKEMHFGRMLTDGNGLQVDEVSFKDDLLVKRERAYMVINQDELKALSVNGTIPSNSRLFVSGLRPDVRPGQLLVEVDLSNEAALRGMALEGGDLKARGLAKAGGVDVGTARLSLIEDALKGRFDNSERTPLMTVKEIKADAVKVEGVPLKEVCGRARDPRMGGLSNAGLASWVKDAGRIDSVEMSVDPVTKSMYLNTSVGGQMRHERLNLTDKDVAALNARGGFEQHELKDLVMQLNPKFFRTYAKPGKDGQAKSVFLDAHQAFIEGRSPDKKTLVGKIENKKRKIVNAGNKVGQKAAKAYIKKSI